MKKSRFNQETGGIKSQFQLILIFMKVTVFLTLFCVFQAFAGNSYSQNTRLSMNLSNVSVKNALENIEKESEFYFLYNSKLINVDRPVNLSANHKLIKDILHELFDGTDVKYTIIDRQIVLTPVKFSKEEINTIQQQKKNTISVSGVVKDKNGNPMYGVNIFLSKTQNVTSTDANGKYVLNNIPPNGILVYRFVGYKEVSVPVNNRTTIDLMLESEITDLQEVVVVGYGTQKKVNLTGAVAQVSGSILKSRPVSNVSSALQGVLPGVVVIQNSGQPGSDVGTIRIRGIGSFGAGKNPLILVDGVKASMNDVDQNDVESISVLKDGASAAIYGSEAANGVILITTKKGKNKPLQLSYAGNMGWQSPTCLPNYLSSAQYAELWNEALTYEKKAPKYTAAEIQKFRDGSDPDHYANTDWLGLFYKGSGLQSNHHFDVSGGSENTSYMFSAGYFNQDGTVKGASNTRYTMRSNVDTKIGKRFTAGLNISYSLTDFAEPTNPYTENFSQFFRQINRISPMVPYKYSDGSYGSIGDGNPMAWLESGSESKMKTNQFLGILNGEFEILKGLKIKEIVSYRFSNALGNKFINDIQFYNFPSHTAKLYQGPNRLYSSSANASNITSQSLLTYDLSLGQHTIHAMAGHQAELTRNDYLQGFRKNFLSDNLEQLNVGSTDGQTNSGTASELALESYFGRINYDFAGKYLFEVNARYDGSSRFMASNRWSLFPSASAGWRITQEKFMKQFSFINNLKLRIGWGMLGNQNVSSGSYYPTSSTFDAGQSYTFGDLIASGVAITSAANPILKWEATRDANIGIDAGLFNDKLTFSIDYFDRKSSNLLLQLPIAATYGYDKLPDQNAGDMINRGLEIVLGTHGKMGQVSYDLNFNTTFIHNEVTNLKGTGPWISGNTIVEEGSPYYSFYGYQCEGIFNTDAEVAAHAKQLGGSTAVPIGPGDLKYKDQNNDGVIDDKDRVNLGSYFPGVVFGLNATLKYKDFDLNLLFQGATNVKGYITMEAIGYVDGTAKPSSLWLDRWTATNHSTTFPRALVKWGRNDGSTYPSSFWVKDASYLRLKNIQLGYTVSPRWLKVIKVSSLRLYYSGQNLLTLTKFYKGFDPEAPAGTRGDYYPQQVVHSFGLNVNF